MNNLLKTIFGKTESKKEKFSHIMDFAKKLEEENPYSLCDLVKILIRPLQSELLVSCVESVNHEARQPIQCHQFFMPNSNSLIQYPKNKIDNENFLIHLHSDPILPCPWYIDRYIDNLSINIVHENKHPWKQLSHQDVCIYLPWGIAFVNEGNHSIASAIITDKGTIIPRFVYDMSSLLDEVKCDGDNYFSLKTNEILAPVTDFRIGAIFEIGRLIKKHNILPMHI